MASDRSECPVSRRDAGIAAGLRLGNRIPAGHSAVLGGGYG